MLANMLYSHNTIHYPRYSLSQLYLLAAVLPILWKLASYILNTSQFINDDYSWIRSIIICLLFFIYFPAPSNTKNVLVNIFTIFSLFLVYTLILYSFDILINAYFNKGLKYDYLSNLYQQYASDGSEEELQSINSNYRMLSKDQMIQYKYN